MVKISDNSEEEPKPAITVLKKHLKSPAKFKGTKRFVFNGREAVAFDKPLLVIGSNVEAFNVAGYFYITNRDNLIQCTIIHNNTFRYTDKGSNDIFWSAKL